jgi:hypothetical protein
MIPATVNVILERKTVAENSVTVIIMTVATNPRNASDAVTLDVLRQTVWVAILMVARSHLERYNRKKYGIKFACLRVYT